MLVRQEFLTLAYHLFLSGCIYFLTVFQRHIIRAILHSHAKPLNWHKIGKKSA